MNSKLKNQWQWPSIIIGTLVVFTVFIVSIAVYISKQSYSLVSSEYYPESIVYDDIINSKKAAQGLSELPSIEFIGVSEEIQLVFPETYANKVQSGSLHFYRPDNSALDFTTEIALNTHNIQNVPSSKMHSGYWKVKVSWQMDNIKYLVEKDIFI